MVPRVIKVYSENNHYQHAEVLKRNRAKRQQYGEFYLEGVTPINRAIESGWPMRALIYSAERRLSKWAQEVIANSTAETHLELSRDLMAKLSDKDEPSEVVALVAMPPDDLSRIQIGPNLLVVAFDRPSNPGNLGTIVRSCDALRADGLIISGHAVDLYDPQTIRATVGSLFSLPVVRSPSHSALRSWFAQVRRQIGDLQVVGTSASAEQDILDIDLTRPTVIAIGNETLGLSSSYRELCDVLIRIPIYGSATSLNVACAASIVLYEADRQRRTGLNSQKR